MSNVSFGSANTSLLEKKYNEAIKDEGFKKLVSNIELDKCELMKYTSKLEDSVKEAQNCTNCKGLHMCQNKVQGFVYYPRVHTNHLLFESVACKYMHSVLKERETSCNYYEMPLALKNASMGNIDITDNKRTPVIKWLKNFYDTYLENPHQKGLYLTGSFGSGKTYLVCAMLNELAKKHVGITIVYYPELLRSLKESFNAKEYDIDGGDFASRINKLKKEDILFLDDIGAESVTSWARDEILGTILQYRMDAGLPTFFTSNLNLNELEEHLSSTKGSVDKVKARRIIERIKQLTQTVELISKNRRN